MRNPDPWNDQAPQAPDLSPRELRLFLSVAWRNPGAFTDWQIEFCASCEGRLRAGRDLSPSQHRVLGTGLLYRLWLNEPDLWD